MRELPLETPLFEALGARTPLLRPLEKLGIKTVRDLLWHFPVRYEDFSKIYAIAELEPGQQATIQAAVEDVQVRHTRRGFTIVEAILADESESIKAVWFNQPYIANTLRPGKIANFSGKVSISEENEIYLNGPAYEIQHSPLGEEGETTHTGRLVPIYPETKGITSRGIRFLMQRLLKQNPTLDEWLPDATLENIAIPEIHKALQAIHFPSNIESALAAQKRFSFENLFLLQLWNIRQKSKLSQKKAPSIAVDIERVKKILSELPFALTHTQKQSLWEIIQDMGKMSPMNRLLQGDVGSGKTIVAAIAAILTAENGYQSAFLAPTEILVRQHFETLKKLLAGMKDSEKPTFALLTASGGTIVYGDGLESAIKKEQLREKVAKGEIGIVIGTHALIQHSISFKNLALIIVDEQHRFGVKQRAELARGEAHASQTNSRTAPLIPHFLSMSATPIPRTLTLTVFGDLDLSLITELPAGRKPITTKVIPPAERSGAYAFIRSAIKSGRQAFVICPRIDPDDQEKTGSGASFPALEMKSVKEEYEKLSKTVFPDLRVVMLHGQMKPKEKETVMREFKDGKHDIMVATSVIEVGVDVPNATIMMIEGAERFGLAQLYQFRGRIGRGSHESYCFLMANSDAQSINARLKAILKAKNGFELAEYDLKLRGPGQFFGQVQTGFPDPLMNALQNPELVKQSRESALEILTADPGLKKYAILTEKISDFEKQIHQE